MASLYQQIHTPEGIRPGAGDHPSVLQERLLSTTSVRS